MMQIEFVWPRRRATFTPDWTNSKYGITTDKAITVHVLGLFPVVDSESADAYFVIELPNGRCMYAGVDTIRFTDVYEGDECSDIDSD